VATTEGKSYKKLKFGDGYQRWPTTRYEGQQQTTSTRDNTTGKNNGSARGRSRRKR
jgi:hypothetical protein